MSDSSAGYYNISASSMGRSKAAVRARRILRVVALANTGYFGIVGAIGLFFPALIAALFHLGIPDPGEEGVLRLLCALILTQAVLLFLLAKQKEGYRILGQLALAGAGINLFADLAAWISHDMSWGQLGVAIIGQVVLAAAIVLWLRTPGAAQRE